MKAICLKFYLHEQQKHKSLLAYEWLLEFAKKEKIPGGSAFRAVASYGRHGTLHEERFFELAPDVAIEVTFILERKAADSFLLLLKNEKLSAFYTEHEVSCSFLPQSP